MCKNIKRCMAFLLASIIVIALLAACGNKQQAEVSKPPSGNTAGDTSKQTQSTGPEPLTLPIVTEPLTLTCFWTLDSKMATTMKSYEELAFFQEMEKRTGIHISFMHPAAGQENEQFNLMLASKDLPDMIYWNWGSTSSSGGPAKAIEDGSIIKLNDWIDKYAPNLKKLFDDHPDWRKQATLDDGTLYMIPKIKVDGYVKISSGFQMRKDWLDKLGLKVPTTIDEWYKTLEAFRENDPNGNGQKDELPFVSQGLGGLQNLEYAWGVAPGFYKDGNTVKFGPIEAGYKGYLATMNQWYKEGLIDPDYPTTDSKNFQAKVIGNKGGSYYGMVNGNMGVFLDLMKPKDPTFALTGVPFPIGPAGKSYGGSMSQEITGSGVAISTKNTHVNESIKYWDYIYGPEGDLLCEFGIEGKSYTMVNGKPQLTDEIVKNPDGLPATNALCRYTFSVADGPGLQRESIFRQVQKYQEQQDTVDTWLKSCDSSLKLPILMPTTDEAQRLSSIMGDINTYVEEMFNKFITGSESLDSFNAYVEKIKSMGLDNALKIEQAMLDRYNAKK